MCVLANLEYLSILFCAIFWAAAPGLVAVLPMWDSPCVWYCHVPGHWLSSGPWQESGPIWAFFVIWHQADWLFHCRHLSSLDRSPQDVFIFYRVRLHSTQTFHLDAQVLDCPFLQPRGLVDYKCLNRSVCRLRLFSSRFLKRLMD